MRTTRTIQIVSCHAEGEVGDVIVGGVAPPPGDTLWAQSRFIAARPDAAQFRPQRTARRRLPPRQPAGAAEGPARADGLHHHGARGHAADVGLELDLRRDRAARHRHRADDRAAKPASSSKRPAAWSRSSPSAATARPSASPSPTSPSFADRLDAPLEVEGLGTLTRRHRLWRRQFRHRRCQDARLCDRPRRGARARRNRHPHHPRRQRAARLHPPDQSRLEPHFVLPDRRAARARRRHADRRQRRRHPARQDRPLAHRHRRFGPHGGAARARRNAGRRQLSRPLHHRLGIPGPHRSPTPALAGRPAIIPSISGRAWITGTRTEMLDPTDPWPAGYKLSDTWPRLTK